MSWQLNSANDQKKNINFFPKMHTFKNALFTLTSAPRKIMPISFGENVQFLRHLVGYTRSDTHATELRVNGTNQSSSHFISTLRIFFRFMLMLLSYFILPHSSVRSRFKSAYFKSFKVSFHCKNITMSCTNEHQFHDHDQSIFSLFFF